MATADTRPSEGGSIYNFCSVGAFKQANKQNNEILAKIANQRVKDIAKKGDAPREPEMEVMMTAALASCAKGDKNVADFYDILCHMTHVGVRCWVTDP